MNRHKITVMDQTNMYGWDVVFGASKAVMNTQLSGNTKDLITKFSYVRKMPDSTDGINFDGQFGAWSIAGGSNSLIHIQIPIQQGTMIMEGVFSSVLDGTGYEKSKPIDIGGINFTIEIRLAFKVDGNNPNSKVLTFDFEAEGDAAGKADLSIIKLSDPDNKLKNNNLAGIFKESMVELLSANKDKITFIFARVMAEANNQESFTPRFTQFFYSSPEGGDHGFLNILGMVYHDGANGNQAIVDPVFTQDPGTQLYQAFSQDLFLNKVIQPLLPNSFGNGATSDSFRYDFTNHVIKNNGTLNLNTVSKGPVDFYPKIRDLSFSINDRYLRTEIHGTCDLHILTLDDMTFSYIANNEVTYDQDTKKFVIHPDPNPQQDHDLDIPWYDYVAAAAASALGVGIVMGLIVVAISSEVLSLLSDSVGEDSASGYSASTLDNIPITWNGVDDNFQVTSAGLSQNLFLMGKV